MTAYMDSWADGAICQQGRLAERHRRNNGMGADGMTEKWIDGADEEMVQDMLVNASMHNGIDGVEN